ncbi:O-methyltransferase [Favolaschia claudopus]|uniref:O-methyltransferase n=1 Tax=Favolaschia claudopus TaxID=2862362 RepID=A0AAW0DLG5_9AGAR
MTFAVLRALHTILGDALHDIETVYATAHVPEPPSTHRKANSLSRVYASPPPSPSSSSSSTFDPTKSSLFSLDFPSLDAPCDPNSPAEQLTTHPTVVAAINRIVAAAGQMAATVQVPFLTLCDAGMGYHLPSCLRVFEAAHVVEVLRDGPVHVREIAASTGVEQAKLAHILRLLATHHILRETAPDVFAVNRISSLLDSGKHFHELVANPQNKYASAGDTDSSAVAAFVGLNCDELYKSSGYLTESVFPGHARLYPTTITAPDPDAQSNTKSSTSGSDPTRAPFNYAFGCEGVGYFGWLEGEGWTGEMGGGGGDEGVNPNQFRLERFGKAMAGTGGWEAPGAVLQGFDWASLPQGSVIVDVGGGIGSTSMLLASAYADVDADGSGGLRFVIQDRPVVVELGEKAWRAKCPELLDSGAVRFQVHDFFTPQPITNAAVFFLRVVLHDWPDAFAHRILLRLREAATAQTKLVLGDFVLPLACVDDFGVEDCGGVEGGKERGKEREPQVEGAEKMLAPAPLLANLGKASANAYWMDLTMQVTFNGQERTLREIVALALSAGWKVVRVAKAPGSLFGHITAVPVSVPAQRRARAGSGSAFFDVPGGAAVGTGAAEPAEKEIVERASSRCGTPTFGSRIHLPSVAEARARFGGGVTGRRPFGSGSGARPMPPPPPLKQAAVLTAPPLRKKKPSPLSAAPPPPSPSPNPSLSRTVTSPRQQFSPHHTSPIARRVTQAPLRSQPQQQHQQSPAPSPVPRQAPPSPLSPRNPIGRRSSYAHLSSAMQLSSQNHSHDQSPTPPPRLTHTLRHAPSSPVLKQTHHQHQSQPSPPSPVPSRIPALTRRASHAQLQFPQTELRKRSGTIIGPNAIRAAGSGGDSGMSTRGHGLGSLLLMGRPSGGALDFGVGRRKREDGDGDGESTDMSMDDEYMSRGPSPAGVPLGSVLAAAARIERGGPRSSSPGP